MRIAVGCLLLAATAGGLAARDDDWKEFRPKGGRFTIRLPGAPKETSREYDSPAGKVRMNSFVVQAGPNGVYGVAYGDYPEGTIDPEQIGKHLDGAQEGAVAATKGKLVESKDIKLADQHPGREITCELPAEKWMTRTRIYFVGRRLYQVHALGMKEFIKGEEVGKVLDSFKLAE
ncbi:MAG: hypothetical protein K2X82_26445 [Gemmataceae bacterium]|nr:hypothetical protein [Gemmataceae bacterium]